MRTYEVLPWASRNIAHGSCLRHQLTSPKQKRTMLVGVSNLEIVPLEIWVPDVWLRNVCKILLVYAKRSTREKEGCKNNLPSGPTPILASRKYWPDYLTYLIFLKMPSILQGLCHPGDRYV